MVSSTAMLRMTSARPTVRCVQCDLVQFVTVSGDCRRCKKSPYKIVTQVALEPEQPSVAQPAMVSAVLPHRAPSESFGFESLVPQEECGTGAILTPPQVRAIECVAGGLSNAEGAKRMGVAIRTFKGYMNSVLRVLGIDNRVTLAMLWHCELYRVGLRELNYL